MLNEIVSRGTRALRQTLAVHDFDLKANVLRFVIVERDEEAAHIHQTANLRVDAVKELIEIERRAERTANFVEDVQLFAAPRSLLDQVAIFDGHADLMA